MARNSESLRTLSSAAQLSRRFALLDTHIDEMTEALHQDDDAPEPQRPRVFELPRTRFTDDELERF